MPRHSAHLRRSLAARRRALLLAWAELLERVISDGPRPLRPLFEAELAFERWASEAWHRLRPRFLALFAWIVHNVEDTLTTAGPRLEADADRLTSRIVATARIGRRLLPRLPALFAWAVRNVEDTLTTAGPQLEADADRLIPRVVATARTVHRGWRRIVDAADDFDRRVSRRLPEVLSRHHQRRLAESLIATAAMLAVLGVAAAGNLDPNVRPFTVDRLASGAPARNEALAPQPEPAPEPAPVPEEQAAPPAEAAADAPSVAPPPPPPPPAIPAQRGPVPVGKGMWIYVAEQAEGGNAEAIVARATATGLTHLYVRTGTLKGGFFAADFLNRLLPKAHAAGLRVYAWDFPYLDDVAGDVNRAVAAIRHLTPDGHRVDGYAADIELRSMGVNVTPETATAFGTTLRRIVGPNYPLIATVPRPSPALMTYPFAEVVAAFDAIAPMVYWLGQDPATHVIDTIKKLAPLGKPIIPVGQAYDGIREGGPPGVPPRDQLQRFMQAAEEHGAVSVSWWSWQHADQQAWDAVRDATSFTLPLSPALSPWQVRAYQTLVATLGFPMPITGVWDEPTINAVKAYQAAARLPQTGVVDEATRTILLSPFAPPLLP
jgi:hypothetical protein